MRTGHDAFGETFSNPGEDQKCLTNTPASHTQRAIDYLSILRHTEANEFYRTAWMALHCLSLLEGHPRGHFGAFSPFRGHPFAN